MPAHDVVHRQRHRQQQLECARSPVFGQLLAGFDREPDFEGEVQHQGGQNGDGWVQPDVAGDCPAHQPPDRYAREEGPDMDRLVPGAGRQPIERIRLQGPLAERALPGGWSVSPGVPEIAPAALPGAGRPVLPGTGNNPSGG